MQYLLEIGKLQIFKVPKNSYLWKINNLEDENQFNKFTKNRNLISIKKTMMCHKNARNNY